MNPWRWETIGDMVVLGSLAAYAASLAGRIAVGDLTTAESSVITQLLVVVGLILGFTFQQIGLWQVRRQARRDRVDDKADQAQRAVEMANYVKAQGDIAALQSQLAHAETMAHLSDVRDTAKVAFETANHSNEKIARLAEHIDSSLQIVPAVAAAVADALKPPAAVASLERTPGTVLTETLRPADAPISE